MGIEFNKEIPQGKPQLSNDYWTQFKKDEEQNLITIFDANQNKALNDISIFKGKE